MSRKNGSCFGTILKWLGFIFLLVLLSHWLVGGQEEIIEGPPETPDGIFSTTP